MKRGFRKKLFDNIIGRNNLISQLKTEILERTLPSALLFYGSPYSGKLTAALELARVLTCEKGGAAWSCGCVSCRKQRLLLARNTVILGSRYFTDEISACAEVLKRTEKEFAQYLFIRSVRKLTRRFDPVLYDGTEPKYKKVQTDLAAVEELIVPLLPGNKLPPGKKLDKTLNKIIELSGKISSEFNGVNIPISQIRRLAGWAHTTQGGGKKIIILESADKMMESSRNSILKILEEPPKGVYFILLASRKGGIIPTILSRVRQYHFGECPQTVTDEVFTKIFREEAGAYKSIREYFLSWKDINLFSLRSEADIFLSLVSGDPMNHDINEMLQKVSDKKVFRYFLEELNKLLQEKLHDPDSLLGFGILGKWNSYINEALNRREVYNQNPLLLMESLFYQMKEY